MDNAVSSHEYAVSVANRHKIHGSLSAASGKARNVVKAYRFVRMLDALLQNACLAAHLSDKFIVLLCFLELI